MNQRLFSEMTIEELRDCILRVERGIDPCYSNGTSALAELNRRMTVSPPHGEREQVNEKRP